MKKKIKYQAIFQRNYGYYSVNEINKIKKLRVAIAGAGGLGGYIASSLTRLGVGYIRISDPDVFEPHNLNRQYGSEVKNLGKNKALVVADNCKSISPYLRIDPWDVGVDEKNVNNFLHNIDAAVDVIEYFQPEAEIALHNQAKKQNIWIFTGQVAGSSVSATAFDPKGKSFQDIFLKKGKFDYLTATLKMFPVFSKDVTLKKIKYYISKKSYIPAYAMPAPVISNLIVEQLISKMIRGQRPLAIAPKYFGIDIHNLKVAIK